MGKTGEKEESAMSLLVGPFAKKLVAFMDATATELEKSEEKSDERVIAKTLRVMAMIVCKVAEV